MSLGNNLRRLLEENGMTQKDLARHMNIAPSTMGCYVQNTREPDYETLKRIANYFDVSIDFLLDHHTSDLHSDEESDLLRLYRSLTPEQQELYLEQGRAFKRVYRRPD